MRVSEEGHSQQGFVILQSPFFSPPASPNLGQMDSVYEPTDDHVASSPAEQHSPTCTNHSWAASHFSLTGEFYEDQQVDTWPLVFPIITIQAPDRSTPYES